MVAIVVVTIVCFLIAIPLVIKVADTVACNIFPVLKHGRTWINAFRIQVNTDGVNVAIRKHLQRRWEMSGVLRISSCLYRIHPSLSKYFYRWPTLTFALSSLLMLASNLKVNFVTIILTALLFTSVVVEIANELIDRLTLGVISNFQVNTHVDYNEAVQEKVNWNVSDILRRSLIALLIRVFIVWISFASLYYHLSKIDSASFKTIKNLIDSVYFSIVTLSTTGFGDVSAVSPLAKCYVCTEIGMIWLLVVVVAFHYAATFSVDIGKEK